MANVTAGDHPLNTSQIPDDLAHLSVRGGNYRVVHARSSIYPYDGSFSLHGSFKVTTIDPGGGTASPPADFGQCIGFACLAQWAAYGPFLPYDVYSGRVHGIVASEGGSIQYRIRGINEPFSSLNSPEFKNIADVLDRGDVIKGSRYDDSLYGYGGNDRLTGGGGADLLSGGPGVDTIAYSTSPAAVTIDLNGIHGHGGDAEGDEFHDIENVTGSRHADHLVGNAADNVLDGNQGGDTLEGGGGDDIYHVDDENDVVVERAGEGVDTVHAGISYRLPDDVEILIVTGEAQSGWGNQGDNQLIGNAQANSLYGGDGDDTLKGGGGRDHLQGGDGDDTLKGGGGRDHLQGGDGDDTYFIGHVDEIDRAFPDSGFDTVTANMSYTLGEHQEHLVLIGGRNIRGTGNAQANELIGNAGNNILRGRNGDDVIDGGGGQDVVVGGGGDDRLTGEIMNGGPGDDVYFVRRSSNQVREAADSGDDRVTAFANFTLPANVETLWLSDYGLKGVGNDGDNLVQDLTSGLSGNMLRGGDGDDVLIGGIDGNARLFGDAGNDTLHFGPLLVRINGGSGDDTLLLPAGQDLDLSTVPDNRIQRIETIDLDNDGVNNLTVTAADVLDLSDTELLRVDGDALDAVSTVDNWALDPGGPIQIGAEFYTTYTRLGATLLVDTDIEQSGINLI